MVEGSLPCLPLLIPIGIPANIVTRDWDWWLVTQRAETREQSAEPLWLQWSPSRFWLTCLVLHYFAMETNVLRRKQGSSRACLLFWHSRCYVTVLFPAALCLPFLVICLVSAANTISSMEACGLVVCCDITTVFLGRHLCVVFIPGLQTRPKSTTQLVVPT